MDEEQEKKLISDANRAVAKARWRRSPLRTRLMQGQILKMGRIRKRGYLLCAICDKAMTRDQAGNYIHVNKRLDRDHSAQP